MSIGYERRTLEEIVALLADEGVDTLIDVRLNAISRKPGLSKTALSEGLEDAGIAYHHARELGNPRDNRDAFQKGLEPARERYRERLHGEGRDAFEDAVRRARAGRVALLCVERDHAICHRSAIVDQAMAEHPDLDLLVV